jgi:hypothetical protein
MPFASITSSSLHISRTVKYRQSSGLTWSYNSCNILLSSVIEVGGFGSLVISCFIYLYTFLIRFKSSEEGSYLKPRIPLFSCSSLAFPLYTLVLSSINKNKSLCSWGKELK